MGRNGVPCEQGASKMGRQGPLLRGRWLLGGRLGYASVDNTASKKCPDSAAATACYPRSRIHTLDENDSIFIPSWYTHMARLNEAPVPTESVDAR